MCVLALHKTKYFRYYNSFCYFLGVVTNFPGKVKQCCCRVIIAFFVALPFDAMWISGHNMSYARAFLFFHYFGHLADIIHNFTVSRNL